jgi:hypothetical protein
MHGVSCDVDVCHTVSRRCKRSTYIPHSSSTQMLYAMQLSCEGCSDTRKALAHEVGTALYTNSTAVEAT